METTLVERKEELLEAAQKTDNLAEAYKFYAEAYQIDELLARID